MQSVIMKTYIHAPIEKVWEALSDHEGYVRYKGFSVSKLLKEGEKERNGVGAVREVHGMGSKFVEDIVKFEPPRMFEYKVVKCSRPLGHEIGRVELIPRGEGTEIHWLTVFWLKIPVIGKLMEPRTKIEATDFFYDFLLDMKDKLEAEVSRSA